MRSKRLFAAAVALLLAIMLCACAAPKTEEPETTTMAETEKKMILEIDGNEIPVKWEDNETTEVLKELALKSPVTVNTSVYGGFEQVGSLGTTLPRNDVQTTTEPGDIVLYAGNQLVLFYGSNSWAYTPIAKITDKTQEELETLLGKDSVTVTISVK